MVAVNLVAKQHDVSSWQPHVLTINGVFIVFVIERYQLGKHSGSLKRIDEKSLSPRMHVNLIGLRAILHNLFMPYMLEVK